MAAGTLDSRALPEGAVERERTPQAPAIAEVYEAHFRYVWRCLRSLGVRDAMLDDALQDVFMVVQQKLATFEERANLRTWLYAIALRVARRYRAQTRRDHEPLELDEGRTERAAEHSDLESALQCSEQLLLARAALDALDDEKREVFVFAQVEQMSAPEIAGILGIPVNTVYSRLRAARQAFAMEIQRLKSRPRRSR